MERLALHADVDWLKRIQAHLLLSRRLLASNAHLRELLLYILLLLRLTRIALLRRLVSSLRRTILRLPVSSLSCLVLHTFLPILRLLWHAVRRLLLCLLLAGIAISGSRCGR